MKVLYKALGILSGIAFMIALLLSATEFIAYEKDGYYEAQYAKYGVLDEVDMEMDELLFVTKEMMAYLKGERADLNIVAEISGKQQAFFNEKEKRHMIDVQKLFIGGMRLRTGAFVFALAMVVLLLCLKKGRLLFGGLQWGIGIFLAAIGALAGLMSLNFNKYFTQFHLIFFNNDDWILNPATDRLINIVPEGFFRDTAFWIAGVFLTGAFLLWLLAGFFRKRMQTGE